MAAYSVPVLCFDCRGQARCRKASLSEKTAFLLRGSRRDWEVSLSHLPHNLQSFPGHPQHGTYHGFSLFFFTPRGVFGFVKRVQHKGNKMSCAAKFIPLRSKTRAQAYQERDILATLGHPLVTGLLDQFETRKTLILILELYPAPKPLREFKRHQVPD